MLGKLKPPAKHLGIWQHNIWQTNMVNTSTDLSALTTYTTPLRMLGKSNKRLPEAHGSFIVERVKQ